MFSRVQFTWGKKWLENEDYLETFMFKEFFLMTDWTQL
jgi:hypothetical protein